MYLTTYKPSKKSRTFFLRIGVRRYELEFNWHLKYVTLLTGIKGGFSKKIF